MHSKAKNIPSLLREFPRWLFWRWREQDVTGKTIKQPCFFDGYSLKSKGYGFREAWSTFDDAVSELVDARIDGLGFHFKDMKEDFPLVAIDIDDCRDVETGELDVQSQIIVDELNSYTEVSPSGKGLRIFVAAEMPPGARSKDTKIHRVEFFHRSGFVTVTGDHLGGTPPEIESRQSELMWLYENIFPETMVQRLPVPNVILKSKETEVRWARELLEAINPERANDYHEWLQVGMALKSVDASLLETWDEWSQSSVGYSGPEDSKSKWDSFTGRGITLGSLYYFAIEDGYTPPPDGVGRTPCMEIDTFEAAAEVLSATEVDGLPRMRYHSGDFLFWENGRYSHQSFREDVSPMLAKALAEKYWRVTTSFTASVADILKGLAQLPRSIVPPCWIGESPGFPASECLATPNSIVHVPTRAVIESTPNLLTYSTGCDYDAGAKEPVAWLAFLDSIWGETEHPEQYKQLLQMWFGYCLTGDLHQQKMLLMVGPTRSGKGTIVRVLERIIGGVIGSQLSAVAGNFGLQSLIGKSLCVFGDMRLAKTDDKARITEVLLQIVGEDPVQIARKFKDTRHMRIPIKLMGLCNELPSLPDESEALLNRYLLLEFFKSFAGSEDLGLDERLEAETSGILNWALEGWDMLHAAGSFIEPDSAAGRKQALSDVMAPMASFVRECLEIDPRFECPAKDVYEAYEAWCEETGSYAEGCRQMGKLIRDAVPTVSRYRARIGNGDREYRYRGIRISEGFEGDPR